VTANPLLVHQSFELLAFGVGAALYRRGGRHHGATDPLAPPGVWVTLGCVFGALLGSKLTAALELPHVVWADPGALLRGQSMVGGLVGGWLGVELMKRVHGLRDSTGDRFVLPVAVGLAIGRVGCFLAGLPDGTYGTETDLPWGVDFGDGVRRHPVQLYEIAVVLVLALLLTRPSRLATLPGMRFRLFFDAYLLWRVGIEFWKPLNFEFPGGLHGTQLVALVALAAHLPGTARALATLRREGPPP
jgi:phosphatidylglycerol:prolipoprotein diacylglycerol transferase